tara:strand:+ start:569 stop:943 length:375 start_codon:yes stop_codon:yes gene_type:complete
MKLPKLITMKVGKSEICARLTCRRYCVHSPLLFELLKAHEDLSQVSEDARLLNNWLENIANLFRFTLQNRSIIGALTIGDEEGAHAFVALCMWQQNQTESLRVSGDPVAWWFQRFVEISTAEDA